MTEIFAWGRRTDVGPGTGERFAHAREAVSVVRPAAERFSVSVVRVPLSNKQRSLPRPRRVYVSVFTGNHPGSTFRHSNDMGGLKQSQWTPTKRRGPIAAEFSGPGPAAVALPTLFGNLVPESKRGRAPAFSFGARHNEKNDSAGPGPGQYNITGLSAKGKDTPPSSTLHSRPKETRPDNFPAPGDYNPENSARAMHEHSPEYTFGLKTQLDKPSANPAPNVYNIPTVMGAAKEGHFRAAPSFSIAGRTKEFPDGRLLNPGPGAYNDVSADSIKPKSPAYTVSARYTVPGDSSPRPGPGAYSPEKVQVDLQPAHSFGIKHSPYSHTYGIGY